MFSLQNQEFGSIPIKFLNHMNSPEFESQLHLLKNILRLFHLHIHKFF